MKRRIAGADSPSAATTYVQCYHNCMLPEPVQPPQVSPGPSRRIRIYASVIVGSVLVIAILTYILIHPIQIFRIDRFVGNEQSLEGHHDFDFRYGERPWLTATPVLAPGSDIHIATWRALLQEINGIDDEYFDNHIFVKETTLKKQITEGKMRKSFYVTYYFSVDWSYVVLVDGFTYSYGDMEVSLSELQESFSSTSYAETMQHGHLSKIKPVQRIASKEQTMASVRNASPLLKFDVDQIHLDNQDGRLFMPLHATIDSNADDCLTGEVLLENAEVRNFSRVNCIIREPWSQ